MFGAPLYTYLPLLIPIIAIITVGKVLREWLKSRQLPVATFSNQENEQRFAIMEERIQTLERIVTDQRSQLRNEINSLS